MAPPRALLDHAGALLRLVLRFDAPADAVVAAYFREHHALGARDRHALADTVFRVLRERRLIEQLAAQRVGDTLEQRMALLAWPGSAELAALDRSALRDALRHNLPDWLAAALQAQTGAEFWPLVQSLNQPAPLDLRVNLMQGKREPVRAELQAHGIESAPTRYSPWGLRVHGKPALDRLDAVLRGALEVQDEGSQLLALLVDARRGHTVVDFCAGAGGKTLALGAAMRGSGTLYAFDTSAHRLDALKPRLQRSGLAHVYPMRIDDERDPRLRRFDARADRVLVDAPCSGLGTLRRNPDLKWRQSPATVAAMREQQASILARAAVLVRLGGRLLYATCSLLDDENEAVAHAFGTAHPRFEPLPAAQALQQARVSGATTLTRGAYLRLWPHLHGTDAYFAALWERR